MIDAPEAVLAAYEQDLADPVVIYERDVIDPFADLMVCEVGEVCDGRPDYRAMLTPVYGGELACPQCVAWIRSEDAGYR